MFKYLKNKIQKLHYKRLFLFGAYTTIIYLTIFATIMDFLFANKIDSLIDALYGLLSFIAYKLVCKRDNIDIASTTLFWISTFIEVLYLIAHSIDFNIIFALFIPILAFYTMKKRTLIINLTLYYLLLISIFSYYYITTSNNIFLHNGNFIFSYIIAHLFILAFGAFYYLAIDEFIFRLERANKTQKLLLKEVHHRVKNNLNLIASILGLQKNLQKDKTSKYLLEQNQHRVESIALLHNILYKNNLLDSTDTKLYLTALIDKIIQSYGNENIKIMTNIEKIELSMNSMLQLGIMINEMLTNTLKHNINSIISIEIVFKKIDDYYHLIYCDNSKNVDLMELKRGFGYNLITLSASAFKSDIQLDNNNKFCYNITLKYLEENFEP